MSINLKTNVRKSFFPMLIFNEETACSTYPMKYDEKIIWFPNNFLRNVARLPQKQTENVKIPDFFIGIDVDLVPSPRFTEQMTDFISKAPQKEKNLYLVVVFEAKNQEVIASIKDRELFRSYQNNIISYESSYDMIYVLSRIPEKEQKRLEEKLSRFGQYFSQLVRCLLQFLRL